MTNKKIMEKLIEEIKLDKQTERQMEELVEYITN